jgi:hypothetical protein
MVVAVEYDSTGDCTLVPIGGGLGYCPVCDPAKQRPILIEARRNCRTQTPIKTSQPQQSIGPGTELKQLLAFFWIKGEDGCGCASKAKEMDDNGPEWCRENIQTIEGWMREAAEKRKLPFSGFVARRLIRLAIRRAERKLASG